MDNPCDDARARFPRGLTQPPGAFRCSEDALLLARFTLRGVSGSGPWRFADLGTGCGVAALALLLEASEATGLGVEIDPELTAAANSNAARLGLAGRFAAHCADLADWPPEPAAFDRVICNPPWRLEGAGKVPPSPARRRALFGTAETLPLFARAAARLLRPGGRAVAVVGAARLPDMLAAFSAANLAPCRLCCVHPRPDRAAVFALVEATAPGPSGRHPAPHLTGFSVEPASVLL